MTAPTIPASGVRELASFGTRRRVDRLGSLVEGYFRAHALIVYAFLYLPIVVVILFSFNANRQATVWLGFSTEWYGKAFTDVFVQKALLNSFIVAVPNAVLATAFGTMAALGLQRVGRATRTTFDGLTYISVIVPEITIALATLIFFASTFDVVNPILAAVQGDPAKPFKLAFGHPTIIAAHVLFNTSLVLLIVRARLTAMDRTLVEASFDLFATPWRTFRQITFPQLLPAVVAGFLLSFTFSFDDYLITTFNSGPGTSTLPLWIFGQLRKTVTPETNAVATMMLAFTLGMLFVGQWLLTSRGRRRGQGQGMAAIITEAQDA